MSDGYYGGDYRRRMTVGCDIETTTGHHNDNGIKTQNMDNGDFSSMYTVKTGTPLMYKMQGESSDMSLSLTPVPTLSYESCNMTDDVTGMPPPVNMGSESSYFCNRYNVRQCLNFLNQVILFHQLSTFSLLIHLCT